MVNTIVALATAPLKSALAVIRLSGDDAFNIANKAFDKDLLTNKSRGIHYGFIKNGEEIIDEVILLTYVAPSSFTGEDVIEIMCHGSMLIVDQIIGTLIRFGARQAERGEFSSRAFYNGKIDLIQAEAINDMIDATSPEAKKLSLLSLQGETSAHIKPLQIKIADLLSLIEVNIDYPEYLDIEEATNEKIINDVSLMLKETNSLLNEGRQGQIIVEGIRVAIVGKPNVGKSSLLNALIEEDKAIVTDIAGTTRDVVEGQVNLHGLTLHLYDTAGIRESSDQVESIGINKARAEILEADLVILVLDASKPLDLEDEQLLSLTKDKKRIIVYNKSDLATKDDASKIYISALKKDISALEKRIVEIFGIEEAAYSRPALNNTRQLGLLEQVRDDLINAQNDAKNELSLDLVAVNLRAAYDHVFEIFGANNESDLSEEIFARFCLGK